MSYTFTDIELIKYQFLKADKLYDFTPDPKFPYRNKVEHYVR